MQNQTTGNTAPRRVMIFIDGSNLYHVLKQNTDKRDLDYKKFSQKLFRRPGTDPDLLLQHPPRIARQSKAS